MTVEVGMAVGQEVGSSVSLVSIGGSDVHTAQLSAGLKAAGVDVENAPKGNVASFAMANAAGYAEQKTGGAQMSVGMKMEQSLG